MVIVNNQFIFSIQKDDLEDRIEVLLDEIETQIERIENEKNTELVEIHKLYY